MKRTDEMKLGENLRGYCDCNQGRLPCTCRQYLETAFDRAANVLNEGGNLDEVFKDCVFHGKGEIKIIPNFTTCPPTTEYPSDRRKDPIQRFSIAAQLQLMKALAILGWAAFILELLGV